MLWGLAFGAPALAPSMLQSCLVGQWGYARQHSISVLLKPECQQPKLRALHMAWGPKCSFFLKTEPQGVRGYVSVQITSPLVQRVRSV